MCMLTVGQCMPGSLWKLICRSIHVLIAYISNFINIPSLVVDIFEFLWMGGWERTESPYPKMDTSKNGLFRWVDDLPKFWGLTVIWLKYIPNDFDSKSKLSEWEHNLWPWFLDIQSWKMLRNADWSLIYIMINSSTYCSNVNK